MGLQLKLLLDFLVKFPYNDSLSNLKFTCKLILMLFKFSKYIHPISVCHQNKSIHPFIHSSLCTLILASAMVYSGSRLYFWDPESLTVDFHPFKRFLRIFISSKKCPLKKICCRYLFTYSKDFTANDALVLTKFILFWLIWFYFQFFSDCQVWINIFCFAFWGLLLLVSFVALIKSSY